MTKGPLIGRGRTATVYEYGEDKVIKLFEDWYEPEWVEHEFNINSKVAANGLPVPFPHEMLEIEGKDAIVYSRVYGVSMLKTFMSKPWAMGAMARLLAEEHARMHKCTVEGLPNLKNALRSRLERLPVAERTKEQLLASLQPLPDGNTLCHGDYHPDNVLMSDKGPVIIDWTNAALGDPLADVARTIVLLTMSEIREAAPIRWVLSLVRNHFKNIYLTHYTTLTRARREEIEQWMPPVIAARLTEVNGGERAPLILRLKTYGIDWCDKLS